MNILIFDSSSKWAHVLLAKDGCIISSRSSDLNKKHSEFLNGAIEEVLRESKMSLKQVHVIGVGIGPGSFTGIRVSTNIARTFSMICNIPLVPLVSLDVLSKNSKMPTLSILNAFKNQIYISFRNKSQLGKEEYAFTQNDFEVDDSPRSISLDQLKNQIKKIIKSNNSMLKILIVGDGYFLLEEFHRDEAFQKIFIRDQTLLDYPTPQKLLDLTIENYKKDQILYWDTLSPLYIRSSSAEEKIGQ